jgi:uncharacterized protein with gpF-like domain
MRDHIDERVAPLKGADQVLKRVDHIGQKGKIVAYENHIPLLQYQGQEP